MHTWSSIFTITLCSQSHYIHNYAIFTITLIDEATPMHTSSSIFTIILYSHSHSPLYGCMCDCEYTSCPFYIFAITVYSQSNSPVYINMRQNRISMHVYIEWCVCTYIYIHVYIKRCVYTYTCIYVYIYIYIYVNMYLNIYTSIYICDTNMSTYT